MVGIERRRATGFFAEAWVRRGGVAHAAVMAGRVPGELRGAYGYRMSMVYVQACAADARSGDSSM